MSDFIEIHWSAGTIDEARKVCRYLAQERLAASAQIIPWVESILMWNNKLDTVQESLVLLKTRLELYGRIREIIEQNCTYEIPQITYTVIDGGNEEYMAWLEQNTPDFTKKNSNSR